MSSQDEPGRIAALFSVEHRRYVRSAFRCPTCQKRRLGGIARFLRPDGTTITPLYFAVPLSLGRETVAECKSCGARWPVFASGPTEALDPVWRSEVEIVEGERSKEHDHTDPMELDNLGGTSPLRHTQTITQEWTQTVEVDTEKTKVGGATGEIDLAGIGTVGRKTEETLKSRYSISEETRKVLTLEFSFEVPPRTKRDVSFVYKRVWQNGVARITNRDGATVEVPFRVAVDMTIDLAQKDTTA